MRGSENRDPGGNFMKIFKYKNKSYDVDDQNFLIDCDAWDNEFARGMAEEIGMTEVLTDRHWEVIHFIRNPRLPGGS